MIQNQSRAATRTFPSPLQALRGLGDLVALAKPLGEFMARNFLAAYGHCSSPENVQAAVAKHYGESAQLRQILDPGRLNLLMLAGVDWVGHAQLSLLGTAPSGAAAAPAIELSRFYVDTRFHGQGAAQEMMAEVKRRARASGAASLWLSVSVFRR